MPVLINTAPFIDVLRGHEEAQRYFLQLTETPYVSALTRTELYAGMRGETEKSTIDGLLAHTWIIPVTDEIAQQGGLIRNRYGPSHGVGIVDALIAATAQAYKLGVITLNTKHFPTVACEKPY